MYYAIIQAETPLGISGLMAIQPHHRTIEIGGVIFSPSLACTPGATEVHYLLMRHVFDELGYRRCEWECHDLNERSKRAAVRLGFRWEGTKRLVRIVKGRSRDTSWFAVVEGGWGVVRRGLEGWLDRGNFGEGGRQRRGFEGG